jgi:medium-chain acyl-[acyl-carrier-protein] hydrolase
MNKKEIKTTYRVPFKVRSYEVNPDEQATLPSFCNYFQEAAGVHARHLNFDISQLRDNGNTWVLYKMHVKLNSVPKRWQDVEVITWPSSGDGVRAFRDYELRDENDTQLAIGISQWMVLNLKTRRPVRMPEEILAMGLNSPEHVIEPVKSPVKGAAGGEKELITTVGSHDLDMNSHVNNVRYIGWITGYLPESVTGSSVCREIEIQYSAEAVKGDKIFHTYNQEKHNSSIHIRHSLYRNDEKAPIATALTVWV